MTSSTILRFRKELKWYKNTVHECTHLTIETIVDVYPFRCVDNVLMRDYLIRIGQDVRRHPDRHYYLV